jgi:hypothetical protein
MLIYITRFVPFPSTPPADFPIPAGGPETPSTMRKFLDSTRDGGSMAPAPAAENAANCDEGGNCRRILQSDRTLPRDLLPPMGLETGIGLKYDDLTDLARSLLSMGKASPNRAAREGGVYFRP